MMENQILQGDCLTVMPTIPDKSVDMILCDLPYGTTQNKWDSIIPLDKLWTQYNRIIKENGAIVLTAQTPFDKVLGCSNLDYLKYEWIWEKEMGTGHLNAKKAPLKIHENVLVFYRKPPTYNPQFKEGKPYQCKSGRGSTNYGQQVSVVTDNQGLRYPTTIIKFARDKEKFHPTQKPVALFEYLILTYTNEGEVVLDSCAGSGTTGIACLNTKRKFILIEQDESCLEIIRRRIGNVEDNLIPG